uniref:Inositol polyphosphate-related phosphatase domain-containing protein n=1 Tax=Panagrolaimus superbus TaxID=310955 RepID=A0A914Y664_9BILA
MLKRVIGAEYQFVASNAISKPFRTKGAIAICFRILKTSFVFISAHFSHGNLRNRILDFRKASTAFNFRATLSPHSHIREDHSIFNADHVFWFGDLNFRLTHRLNSDQLAREFGNQLFIQRNTFEKLLEKDELQKCISTKLAFHDFKEGIISFPPTYKFAVGTQTYAKHRVPSYTDRILFWCKHSDNIRPIRYDCVWPITVSDHKAVYGIFSVRVMDPHRSFSSNVASLDIITPSNPITEQILVDL